VSRSAAHQAAKIALRGPALGKLDSEIPLATVPPLLATPFYRYKSASGRTVIVDSLDRIPPAERANVERIDLEAPPAPRATSSAESVVAGVRLDWPSFATGFGAALALAAVLLAVTRSSRWLLGVVAALSVAIVGTGLYLGHLRRTAGQSGATFASPSAIIEDARDAVKKAQARETEQDRVIRELQKEAR
jgi:hypothetical protein